MDKPSTACSDLRQKLQRLQQSLAAQISDMVDLLNGGPSTDGGEANPLSIASVTTYKAPHLRVPDDAVIGTKNTQWGPNPAGTPNGNRKLLQATGAPPTADDSQVL